MCKKSYGQNLVEFTLVAPILILILVAVSELGYSFIIKHKVINCVKQVVQSSHYNLGKSTDLLSSIKTDLEKYIQTENIPPAESLEIFPAQSDIYGTAVVIRYTYKPNFRLLGAIPEVMTISSSQVIQSAVLKTNNSSLTTYATLPDTTPPL